MSNKTKPQAQSFIIQLDLAQAIANYLARRPYGEVAMMMEGLSALPPFTEAESREHLEEE